MSRPTHNSKVQMMNMSTDNGEPQEPLHDYDICIIGTGRVGLPLALSLMEVGVRVTGIDLDPALRASVAAGVMPFAEPGYDELIGRRQLVVTDDASVVRRSAALVLTVGTPLHNHIETDLSQIERALNSVLPHIQEGHLICLRSTVAPGTTRFVHQWLEQNTDFKIGQNLFLAFCPERIAEGKAHDELRTLPQIVGAEDPESLQRAMDLFSVLAAEVMPTTYATAELVKLFNNISRYVNFALSNQFAMISEKFGANIHEARELANHNYPRSYLAAPGFTAGTCLRKDFGMINEWSPYPDLLLSAWKVNEYMPAFLVEGMEDRQPLNGKRVAVLGFSFKADTDDLRDSLAPKLWRYIHRKLPAEIRVSDHNLKDPIPEPSAQNPKNYSISEALENVEVVFIATNHREYYQALQEFAFINPNAWVADIWNVGKTGEMFYRAADLQKKEN